MTWWYDQWITTHGLLLKKICTVPPWSGLWNKKGLKFDPYFDDSKQCWHGNGYKDCNLKIHIIPHGCKWWHFFPFQTFQEHVWKLNKITGNSYHLKLNDLYHNNWLSMWYTPIYKHFKCTLFCTSRYYNQTC